eukprot:1455054-Rhodomonas_salina.1
MLCCSRARRVQYCAAWCVSSARVCLCAVLSYRPNQTEATAISVQFVPGMRFLVFENAAWAHVFVVGGLLSEDSVRCNSLSSTDSVYGVRMSAVLSYCM